MVLDDEDEPRLTSWMSSHLQVSWCEHPAPRDVETGIIERLAPPLNVDHASGPTKDVIKTARRKYRESAGPPPA